MLNKQKKQPIPEAPKAPAKQAATPPAPKTAGPVRMFRSAEDAKGGPMEADVHPSEVENWTAAGWKIKE